MRYNSIILSAFVILSCYSPVKVTKIVDRYPNDTNYQSELIIYFSLDEIERSYTVIANIQLENNVIYGNFQYDDRIKDYLLDRINEIGADAIIYHNKNSDSSYSYFDAIKYKTDLFITDEEKFD